MGTFFAEWKVPLGINKTKMQKDADFLWICKLQIQCTVQKDIFSGMLTYLGE